MSNAEKPREWWIQLGTPDIIAESSREMAECQNESRIHCPIYHVIEKSAFDLVVKERDELATLMDDSGAPKNWKEIWISHRQATVKAQKERDERVKPKTYGFALKQMERFMRERDALAAQLRFQIDANQILAEQLAEAKQELDLAYNVQGELVMDYDERIERLERGGDECNWTSTGPGGCDDHNIEHPCGKCLGKK